MLDIINALLIIIIITVLIVDTIYIHRMKKDIIDLQNTKHTFNLLDLAELNGLDSRAKENYKKYILNDLLPPIVGKINVALDESKVYDYLDQNEYAIKRHIQAVTDSL